MTENSKLFPNVKKKILKILFKKKNSSHNERMSERHVWIFFPLSSAESYKDVKTRMKFEYPPQ